MPHCSSFAAALKKFDATSGRPSIHAFVIAFTAAAVWPWRARTSASFSIQRGSR
jgi:hypothetical protein